MNEEQCSRNSPPDRSHRFRLHHRLLRAFSVSTLNQAVSSGTNFVLGIFLVKMLSPEDFGLYGIGFAVSLFYANAGNALFLTQMVVYSPDKKERDRVAYAGRILLMVLLFCLLTFLITISALSFGVFFSDTADNHIGYILAVLAASIAFLVKEFYVRHSYNFRKEVWALIIHSAIAGVMMMMLWIQYRYRYIAIFDVNAALTLYAVAQVCGVLAGSMLSKVPISFKQWDAMCADFAEAWRGGKWASLTNIVYFVRIQAHTIVVAALIGPIGVAKLNAARLLVTPAVMLTPALCSVAMPRLAAVRNQSERKVVKMGMVISLALLAIAVCYSTALLLGYEYIVMKVLGETYQNVYSLVVLWCAYTCLLALRNGADLSMQILMFFRRLSMFNLISAIATLTLTLFLTIKFSCLGTLSGLIMGEFILIVFVYKTLFDRFNNKS